MKLKITEHLPVYVSGSEPEIVEFSNARELLELEFVKGHSHQLGFFRYSIHPTSGNIRVPLLAEYNGGEKWIVIGFLDGEVGRLELPVWQSRLIEKEN